MDTQKFSAILLLLAGSLGLAGMGYGGFSDHRPAHQVSVGTLQVSAGRQQDVSIPVWVSDEQPVNVALWAGVCTIVIGGLLLVWSRKS